MSQDLLYSILSRPIAQPTTQSAVAIKKIAKLAKKGTHTPQRDVFVGHDSQQSTTTPTDQDGEHRGDKPDRLDTYA